MELMVNKVVYKSILYNISFSLTEGDVVALIGANGAGKTTLLKNIMGLIHPSSGSITLDGSIASVFQENILDEELTVKQNYQYRINNKKNCELALSKLDKFGVDSKNVYSKLSGGQKRIANYVRAMAMRPTCLILDELSAGIDVDIRQAIWNDLRDYLESNSCGVIFTTHQLDEMSKANKVLFLESGNVKYFGSMENFMDRMPKVKLLTGESREVQYFDSSERAVEFVQKNNLQTVDFEIMKTSYTDLFQAMEAGNGNVH